MQHLQLTPLTQLLHVGNLECDEGWFKRGVSPLPSLSHPPSHSITSSTPQGRSSTATDPNPPHVRRKLIMLSILISHPEYGLVLYETGGGENYPEIWGSPANDVFARTDYTPAQELAAQIAITGHNIKD